MRLLRRSDDGEFVLHSFGDNCRPPYAILSHTWNENLESEVSFTDVSLSSNRSKMDYKKLEFCARQAARDRIQYFWIDTCCIDQSNAAELSEAINSMYQWYQEAEVCYAYLADVSVGANGEVDGSSEYAEPAIQLSWSRQLRSSAWFKRGWTLQELIAPKDVEFFSREQKLLGNRIQLSHSIAQITGIPAELLHRPERKMLHRYSVAQRMSWASQRNTRKVEDLAYCLLGIFNIQMSLLYGEGKKSFRRLQEEILISTGDFSIFAWKHTSWDNDRELGIFAQSPASFSDCQDIILSPHNDFSPWMRTASSIVVSLPMLSSSANLTSEGGMRAFAILPCGKKSFPGTRLAVGLRRISAARPWTRADGMEGRVLVKSHEAAEASIGVAEILLDEHSRTSSFNRLYFQSHGRFAARNLTDEIWESAQRFVDLAMTSFFTNDFERGTRAVLVSLTEQSCEDDDDEARSQCTRECTIQKSATLQPCSGSVDVKVCAALACPDTVTGRPQWLDQVSDFEGWSQLSLSGTLSGPERRASRSLHSAHDSRGASDQDSRDNEHAEVEGSDCASESESSESGYENSDCEVDEAEILNQSQHSASKIALVDALVDVIMARLEYKSMREDRSSKPKGKIGDRLDSAARPTSSHETRQQSRKRNASCSDGEGIERTKRSCSFTGDQLLSDV